MAPPLVFYPNLNFIAFNGLHPLVFSHTAGIFSFLQLFICFFTHTVYNQYGDL